MTKRKQKSTNQTNEENVKKTLKPKNDVVFQRLFNKDNQKITKAFAEAMLDEKIHHMTINEDKELLSDTLDKKTGILDLQIDVNNTEKVDVEVQLVERSNLPERLLFYFSKLYLKGIGKGEDYRIAKRVVLIAIIDYNLKIEIEDKKMETIWQIVEKNHPKTILTNKFEIHILELEKVKEEYKKNKENKKAQWLLFLDDPETKEVKEIMEKNEDVKEAVIEVRKLSQDEQLQREAELREKAIMDEKAIYQAGLDNGKEEGRAEGHEEGRAEGEKIGHTKAIKEMAKKLLKQDMKIETIAEITGLTIEEIEKLKEE